MMSYWDKEVSDWNHDGNFVLRHKYSHQPCLEHTGGEERKEDNDQGEHQAYILNAKNRGC